MLLRMPVYCRGFRCSADSCTDNCCIGWEIDIDDETAEYYRAVKGDFGERLRSGITFNDVYSFVLKNERCPFLNERNLCDIILNLGEDKLCRICTEHPRYYEWFSDKVEGGVGMCCEEAARLILEKGLESGYYEREISDESGGEYDDELYTMLFSAREKLMDLLRDESLSIGNAVSVMLDFAEELQFSVDNYDYGELPSMAVPKETGSGEPDTAEILDIFGSLEPIDEKWKPFIGKLKKNPPAFIDGKYERCLRSVGIYFLWRYFMKGVFDEEILSKVKLSVIGMVMLGLIFTAENADFERSVILAKNYSKELEYSEENLEKIYDLTYTEKVFSSENLKSFLK